MREFHYEGQTCPILEVGRERLRVRLDGREPELVAWGQILDAPGSEAQQEWEESGTLVKQVARPPLLAVYGLQRRFPRAQGEAEAVSEPKEVVAP